MIHFWISVLGSQAEMASEKPWNDFIRHIGDERGRDFNAVQVLKMVLNIPRADSFGVERDDLVFNPCHVLLMLLHDDRFEFPQPIPGDRDFLLAILTDDDLLTFPIAAVRCFLA